MKDKYLDFDIATGRKKPESILNESAACPFCDRSRLTGIIDGDGDLLLIKNKYQVLADSYQTVLIETTDCHSELSEYSIEHVRRLFHFGIRHWLDMTASPEYKSVIFFKNHGALSGGTIRHPHMQIVGFYHLDCFAGVTEKEFDGYAIAQLGNVEFNLAKYPRIGFTEFNIRLDKHEEPANIDSAADFIRIAAHYLLNRQMRCHSYNIFFYLVDGKIRVKVLPRYATSPLYVGYNIHLVSNNIRHVVAAIKAEYFKAGNENSTADAIQ